MSTAGPVVAASNRKLAINRLRERRPLDAGTVDRFLARYEVPIVEGPRCTFLFRGEADEVFLVHRIFGLPGPTPMRRLRGTDLWYVVLELPEGSRVEYQLEVVRGGQRSRFNDPLNPRVWPGARWAIRRSASRTGTWCRTGPCLIPRRGRGHWSTWWCRAARCAGRRG